MFSLLLCLIPWHKWLRFLFNTSQQTMISVSLKMAPTCYSVWLAKPPWIPWIGLHFSLLPFLMKFTQISYIVLLVYHLPTSSLCLAFLSSPSSLHMAHVPVDSGLSKVFLFLTLLSPLSAINFLLHYV